MNFIWIVIPGSGYIVFFFRNIVSNHSHSADLPERGTLFVCHCHGPAHAIYNHQKGPIDDGTIAGDMWEMWIQFISDGVGGRHVASASALASALSISISDMHVSVSIRTNNDRLLLQ